MEYGIIGLLVLVAVLELILLLRAQKKRDANNTVGPARSLFLRFQLGGDTSTDHAGKPAAPKRAFG